jgi:hypothetical protein
MGVSNNVSTLQLILRYGKAEAYFTTIFQNMFRRSEGNQNIR